MLRAAQMTGGLVLLGGLCLTVLTSVASAAPVPTVTSISPTSGPLAGGTMVTITGTGFATTGTTVSFGTAAGTAVSCSSTTSCTATSPTGSAGAVDVTVTVGDRRRPPVPQISSPTPQRRLHRP